MFLLSLLAQATSYEYSYSSSSSSGYGLGSLLMIFLWIFAVFLVIYILSVIPLWKIFEKAGQPGWKAAVPILSGWVLFEISGKPGYWMLSTFIPGIGPFLYMVLFVISMIQLAEYFGKDTTFAILFLFLLELIGLYMLAFGDAKYNGPIAGGGMQPAPAGVANIGVAQNSAPQPPQPSQPPQPPQPPTV